MRKLIALVLMSSVAHAAHFETGSHEPTQELVQEVQKVFDSSIKSRTVTSITVEGHTDSRGSCESNRALSQRRAEAVAALLKSMGAGEVRVYGLGETRAAEGNSEQVHAQNRRVVITVDGQQNVISEAGTKVQAPRKENKNILSVFAIDSRSGMSRSVRPNSTRIESERDLGAGILYQHKFGKTVGGAGVSTNGDVMLSVGLEF